MVTILFIILKLANKILLSWWWIIGALIIDGIIREINRNSYEKGLDEGGAEREE